MEKKLYKKSVWMQDVNEYTDLEYYGPDKNGNYIYRNKLEDLTFQILNGIFNLQEIKKMYWYYIEALKRENYNTQLIFKDFEQIEFLIFKSLIIVMREYNEYFRVFLLKEKYKNIFSKDWKHKIC